MYLATKQADLIADLNLIQDAQERLAALSSYLPPVLLPEAERQDTQLVPGCVSRVWIDAQLITGTCHFRCAADSPIVASLVALLCHLYSGAPPAEVATIEPEVWQSCGLAKHLSPTRLNGLAAVRTRLRTWAAAQK